ncbi:hypothetical protein KP509_32G062300 [Ceratopteris richardii]|uniref:Uncharacterized protein n=1 Tax=Ceratopteris richardii TaxID=49495 RepID=A0A8T2QVJ8_CERRI|nr:hypothetical protein KP509_32G062300 [Ceratopteris richardii]
MKNFSKDIRLSLRNDLNKLSVFLSVRCYNCDAFIALSIPQIRGFWPSLMLLLQKIDVQVINATVSNCANNSFHCIHVKIPASSDIDSDDLESLLGAFIVQELGVIPCKD